MYFFKSQRILKVNFSCCSRFTKSQILNEKNTFIINFFVSYAFYFCGQTR